MRGWLDADKDTLRTMWACGSSSGDIAVALVNPVSRNAVMGMVNRLGLMGLGHADAGRVATLALIPEIMGGEFHTGSPLHMEAFLTLTVARTGDRSRAGLALASGICEAHCAQFVDRLALVWPEGSIAPVRWASGVEGNLAFILDMAVVAGMLSATPVRGRSAPASPVRPAVRRPSWSEPQAAPAT